MLCCPEPGPPVDLPPAFWFEDRVATGSVSLARYYSSMQIFFWPEEVGVFVYLGALGEVLGLGSPEVVLRSERPPSGLVA